MSPLLRISTLSLLVLLACASARGAEPNEKAGRYYDTLKKRPVPGAVFDRFVDAWLDSATLDELEQFLQTRTEARPPEAADRVMLALYYSRQGSLAKAVQQYREALKLDPDNAALWQQKALTEARLLEFDPALASVESALSRKPAQDVALSLRQLQGRLLARSGRTPEAIAVWQALLTERPDDEALREDVMELQIAAGLTDAAVENAGKLVDGAPDAYRKASRRLQLASVLERADKTDAALQELEKCLGDSGADSWLEKEVLARMEQIYRRADNITALRGMLEQWIALYPQRLQPRRARVRLLVELGEKPAAVAAGRELLALAPGDRTAREEFVNLLSEAGEHQEAVVQFAELVRQSPQDRELLLRLAALKLQAGDKPGSLEILSKYENASPGDEAARLRSAGLLEKAGLTAESLQRLMEAIRTFPGSVPLRQALASALHRGGRRDEAVKLWRELASGGGTVLEVARALAAHGEEAEARELLAPTAGGNDVPLLMLWCQLSERCNQAAPAVAAARRLVTLSRSGAEAEQAIDLAARLIHSAGESENVIQAIGPGARAEELCLQARILEDRGDRRQAEAALEQAAKESPDLAGPRLIGIFRDREEWGRALEAGARIFESPGGRKAATAQLLAETAERAQQWEAALRWAGEWRRLSPGSIPAVLAEVKVLRMTGREAEAIRSLRMAAAQFEENRDIREELARLFRETGRSGEALPVYAAMYEQAKDSAARRRVLDEWTRAALEASRLGELEEQFLERKRQNTGSAGPLLALAQIYKVTARKEKQYEALESAVRLRPEDTDIALELADLLRADGNSGEAKEALKLALPHDKTAGVRKALARVLMEEGNQEAGLKLLEEAQTAGAGDPAAVEELAMALTPLDPERALSVITARLAADPQDYRLKFLRASILAEYGRHEEAAKEWIALAGVKSENAAIISRRAAPVFGPAMQAMTAKLTGVVPEEILEVLRVNDAVQRNSQPRWSATSASGGHGAAQFYPLLPGSLVELRAMTAAALMGRSRFSAEISAAAAKALTDAGLSGVLAILGAGDENEDPLSRYFGARGLGTGIPPAGGDVSGANAEELLAGIAGLRCLLGQSASMDSGLSTRAGRKWFDSHPDFSTALVIAALSNHPEADPAELRAVESLVRMEHPHELVLEAAARYLKSESAKQGRSGTQHRRILDRVTRWLESVWIASPGYGTVRRNLTEGVLTHGTTVPELAARVMNAEWPREETNTTPPAVPGGPGSQVVFNRSTGRRITATPEAFLTALTWPPAVIPGVSPVFAAQAEGTQIVHSITHQAVASILPQLKDPVLRARMQDYADRAQHPLPSLTKLAEAADAAPAALLLAAITCAEAGQFEKAVSLAVRLLDAPLPGELRRQLNASIVVWSEESAPAPGTPAHAAACEAAQRLRRDAVTDSQKLELASAMDWLGLADVASALRDSTTMSGGVFSKSGRLRVDARALRVQAMMKRALWDMESGLEEAPAAVARVFLRKAQLALSPAGWDEDGEEMRAQFAAGSVEEEIRWSDFVRRVEQDGTFAARVVAQVRQSRGADAARQGALTAAVYELLGHRRDALEAYRKAIESGCSDPGVHVRLCRMLAADPSNRAEFDGAFLDAPGRAQEWLMGMLLRAGTLEPFESVMRGAELARQAAERMDPPGVAGAAWLGKVVMIAGGELNLPGGGLRAQRLEGPVDEEVLVSPGAEEPSGEQAKKVTEYLEQRRQTCIALNRALTRTPPVAALAFSTLRRISPPGADLTTEALAASVAVSRVPAPVSPVLSAQQAQFAKLAKVEAREAGNVFAVQYVPEADAREPLRYLVDAAVRSGRADLLDPGLAGALTTAGDARGAEMARLLAGLYFGPEEQTGTVAAKLFATSGTRMWPIVVRGLEHRRVKPELNGTIEAEISRARAHPEDLAPAAEAVGDYLLWLCRDGRRDEAGQLLGRAVELLAGGKKQRAAGIAAYIEEAAAAGRTRVVNPAAAAAQIPVKEMLVLLRRLAAEPESSWVAMEVLYTDVLPFLAEETAGECALQVKADTFVSLDFLRTGESCRVFFENSPLVADVEQFRSFGGEEGIFVTVAKAIHDLKNEDKSRAVECLQALHPAFGRDLLLSVAEEGWGAGSAGIVAAALDRLQQLPPERQMHLALMLEGLKGAGPAGESAGGVAPVAQWMRDQRNLFHKHRAECEVEAWLALPAAPVSLETGLDKAAAACAAAIRADSPRIREVLDRTANLVDAGEAPAVMETLLENALGKEPLAPSAGSAARWLGLVTGALAAGDRRVPLFSETLRGLIPTAVQAILPAGEAPEWERFSILVQTLSPVIAPGEGCVLLEAFPLPVADRVTPEQRRKICQAAVAWSAGLGKSLERQDLVAEIAAAAQLELAVHDDSGAASPAAYGSIPPEQAHYLAVLRDESRGLAARLAVAAVLTDYAAALLHPVVLAEATLLLNKSLRQGSVIAPWQRHAILAGLTAAPASAECDAACKTIVATLAGTKEFVNEQERTTLRDMLRLAMRADNGSVVATLLANLQAEGGDPDVMGIILASGHAVRINNLAVDSATVYYAPELASGDVLFDERVQSGLKEALSKIETEELRLRFELAVNCLPSAPGMKPRVERLLRLAGRMKSVMETAKGLSANNLLELLAVEPVAALTLRQYYDERCPEDQWAEILQQRADRSAGNVWKFWMTASFADAAEPNVESLTKRAREFQIKSGAFLQSVCGGISHGWPQWKTESRRAVEQWLLKTLEEAPALLTDDGREALRSLPAELLPAVKKFL